MMDPKKFMSTSPFHDLTKEERSALLNYCKKFCAEHIGKLNVPKVRLKLSPYIKRCYGEYCPETNQIRIFIDKIKTVGMFTSTFLHEYKHSQQKKIHTYDKLEKQFGYKKHPLEIDARMTEKYYNQKLLLTFRKKIK